MSNQNCYCLSSCISCSVISDWCNAWPIMLVLLDDAEGVQVLFQTEVWSHNWLARADDGRADVGNSGCNQDTK